jgi:hypothetical protein
MLDMLRKNIRQLLAGLRSIEARGHSHFRALLVLLPEVIVRRGYTALAHRLNDIRIIHTDNHRAFEAFQRDHAPVGGGHFYLILMPGTLHFVLPCLSLLPAHMRVILIANGAAEWERRYLSRAFPQHPIFKLMTFPGSSLSHGTVLTLLLASNEHPFGVLDHDCYVFDASIFGDLEFGERDCLVAVFGNVGARVAIPYPETYFLYFNSKLLKPIMQRYGVDARAYRKLPPAARDPLATIGVRDGVYPKEYHNYFDTLHVLLLLALAEGLTVRFLQSVDADSIAHVGSTSSGVAHTKDLMHSYVQLRFLELLNDLRVRHLYRRRTHPFRASSEVRSRIRHSPEAVARMNSVEALMRRLGSRVPEATIKD